MRKHIFALLFLSITMACKSSKNTGNKSEETLKVVKRKQKKVKDNNETLEANTVPAKTKNELNYNSKAQNIIEYAKQFEGVKYKYGGATREGMDCSGLIFECFRAYDIFLPRISRDMAKKGEDIPLKKVLEGDLVFFKTGNRRNDISHVGLVVEVGNGDIQFIHASTSNGVMISTMNEYYWTKTFAKARRIL